MSTVRTPKAKNTERLSHIACNLKSIWNLMVFFSSCSLKSPLLSLEGLVCAQWCLENDLIHYLLVLFMVFFGDIKTRSWKRISSTISRSWMNGRKSLSAMMSSLSRLWTQSRTGRTTTTVICFGPCFIWVTICTAASLILHFNHFIGWALLTFNATDSFDVRISWITY